MESVRLIADAELTKEQYLLIRRISKAHHHDLFPSYNDVIEAKKECYPTNIQINEKHCEVKLQDLLSHTTSRILSLLTPDHDANNELVENKYILHVKYGFDGSGGHSRFNQKFSDPESNDAYLFGTFIVPIRLTDKTTNAVI